MPEVMVCVVVEDLERNDGCCYDNGLCCSGGLGAQWRERGKAVLHDKRPHEDTRQEEHSTGQPREEREIGGVKLKSQKKRGNRRTGNLGWEKDFRGLYNEMPFEEKNWK